MKEAIPPEYPWLIGSADFIFQTPVRAKRTAKPKASNPATSGGGTAAQLLGRVRRVTSRKPEVMVKVSGAGRGKRGVSEHLAYITRNGKLVAERESGEEIHGGAAVRDVAAEWWALRGEERPARARDTINLVLSMPPGVSREKVAAAAASFARTEFGGKHDYMLVHHEDTEHPHAHLTVRTVGYDGRCLNPRKADLQHWREGFAEALRTRGVEAEATPRRARGVVQKGQKQAIRHLDKRQASRVTREKIKQAIASVGRAHAKDEAAAEHVARPWEPSIKERQQRIRHSWRTLATALERHGEVGLALQVRGFVEDMPPVATERDAMLQRVAAALPPEPTPRTPEQGRRKR